MRTTTVNGSRSDYVNTLRLLIESGVDVCISVEVDSNTFWLANALNWDEPLVSTSERLKMIGGLSWLFRKYMQATTCDGLLPTNVLHPEACAVITLTTHHEGQLEAWGSGRPDNHLLTRNDTLAFQSYWLFELAKVTEHNIGLVEFSSGFCRAYSGDFHYRLPLEIGGRTIEASPMELALYSFAALGSFRRILLNTGADVKEFAKLECTMPWCHHTQQVLDAFLSLDPEEYSPRKRRFKRPLPCSWGCGRDYADEIWKVVVELVKSGISLDSALVVSETRGGWPLSDLDYCESCRRDGKYSASVDFSSDSEEDVSECMGFVEIESE
jgi:hypothetical protein